MTVASFGGRGQRFYFAGGEVLVYPEPDAIRRFLDAMQFAGEADRTNAVAGADYSASWSPEGTGADRTRSWWFGTIEVTEVDSQQRACRVGLDPIDLRMREQVARQQ